MSRLFLAILLAIFGFSGNFAGAASFGGGADIINASGSTYADGGSWSTVDVNTNRFFSVTDGNDYDYEVTNGTMLQISGGTLAVSSDDQNASRASMEVNGSLLIAASGRFEMDGYRTTLYNFGAIQNYGGMAITNGFVLNFGAIYNISGATLTFDSGSFWNLGQIYNDGTITIDSWTNYTGFGSINNANGVINSSAGQMQYDGFLTDLVGNAGQVNITDSLYSGTFVNSSLTGGTFTFLYSQVTSGGGVIDVGQADVVFRQGGTFNGSVSARTISTGSSGTSVFNAGVNGNLRVNGATTAVLGAASTYTGASTTVASGGTLANYSTSVNNLGTVTNDGTLNNAGNLSLNSYAGSGGINNMDGNFILDSGVVGFGAALSSTKLTGGLVTVNSAAGYAAAMSLSAGSNDGGTMIIDTAPGVTLGNGIDAVQTNGANLTVLNATVFDGAVDAGATGTLTAFAGTFATGAAGRAVTLNGAVTFSGTVDTSQFNLASGGTLISSGGVTVGTAGVQNAFTIGGTLAATQNDAIVFQGTSASSLAFAGNALISLGGGSPASQLDFGSIATSLIGSSKAMVATNGVWAEDEVIFANTAFASEADVLQQFNFGRAQIKMSGNDVVLLGYGSVMDTVGNLFVANGLPLNVNKINGMAMVDAILEHPGRSQIDPVVVGIDNYSLGLIQLLSHPGMYAAGVKGVGQALGEYGDAAREGMFTATGQFLNRLDRRMERGLYDLANSSIGSAVGVAGLDAYASLGRAARCRAGGFEFRERGSVWADFHGGWARQKAKDDIDGYDYDGYGVSLGYERRFGRLLAGFGGGYTRAKTDVDDLAAKYHADVMNLALYSSYLHESGFLAQASLGFAYGWNRYDVSMVLGPDKKGRFHNQSYSANLDLGYVFTPGSAAIIPSVGVRYSHVRQDGWNERGGQVGSVGFFKESRQNMVDIPIQMRASQVFDCGAVRVTPEVRLAWIYAARKNRSRIDYGMTGTSDSYTVQGVNPGRSRARVGGGVRTEWCGRYAAGIEYDFEWRSKYRDHRVTANVGLSF